MLIALLVQPPGYRWRREEWDVRLKRIERFEGQMIGVRVCEQNCIELRKRFQGNPRSAHPGQKFTQRRLKIRISNDRSLADLD
jgi:hypothetical protein